MPTYTAPTINTANRSGGSGSLVKAHGRITGNGAGANVAIGDVLRLVKLPKNCRVTDVVLQLSAATASLTVSAGTQDVDGVAAAAPAAFIVASTSAATTAKVHANMVAPYVDLATDSYITVTTAGAAILAATEIYFTVEYEYLGGN